MQIKVFLVQSFAQAVYDYEIQPQERGGLEMTEEEAARLYESVSTIEDERQQRRE